MKKLCAISVDLDEIAHYHAIHGLAAPDAASASAAYDVALGRLERLASDFDAKLTLFAVGKSLERETSAAALRALASKGYEIANHTLSHRYDLTRLGRDAIRDEIAGGIASIERATGACPTGFRAPGYTITDEVFDVLDELGVGYDSSVFPCPAYYAAKTAAIAWIRARGRTSRSVVDAPRVLAAPTRPYRVGRPYQRRGAGMLEIPVQVTRGARLPFIGTSITLAGPTRARWLAKMVAAEPVVNLELHAIDVLDERDGLGALAPHQPDVRVPLRRKIESLGAALEVLRDAGHAMVRLDEIAAAHASG